MEQECRTINELQEQLRSLTDENLQLRDRNERLNNKLGSVQGKLGQQAASRSDLSAKLVLSEEEKLKISKDLVEAQIEANKMRELYEAETFELKNKVLSQEGVVLSLEAERDGLQRDVQATSSRLQAVEGHGRDLAEEYATLKRNFLFLHEAHEREAAQVDELTAELISLARTQDTLLKERDRARRHAHTHAQEADRVQALISRMSQNRVRPEELAALGQGRNTLEKNLPHNELREELERMRRSYEEQQRRLGEKVVAMGKEQQENKREIRNTQHKLAEQSAALISSQWQLKELEAENHKLQNHLKELNQEYRARLTHYLQDLTEYLAGLGQARVLRLADGGARLRGFVDSMLQEVRASYRSREEQLASAARAYRKRLHRVNATHQALLAAYRMQREQILVQTEHALEPGPPEAHFLLGEAELSGGAEAELQRLREDKARLESQLRHTQEQVAVSSKPTQEAQMTEQAWSDIRKHLREITNATQEAQERERAQLISRATVAEEQVSELQEYVDNHLARYKQEITRLRRLLGLEVGRAHSADLPKPRLLHRSIKNTSYEI